METTTSNPEDSAPQDPLQDLGEPVRVLVQTWTHLIPKYKYRDRILLMSELICKHHFKCRLDGRQRLGHYGVRLDGENRRCYFLVDYGESLNDDDVPIISYEWTGESFKPLPSLAQSRTVKRILKRSYPFTWKNPPPVQSPRAPTLPEYVFIKLHEELEILDQELDFMSEHPEDVKWLKDNLPPELISKFESLMNSRTSEEQH